MLKIFLCAMPTDKILKRFCLLCAAFLAFAAQPATGAIITFTDRASWLTAIGGATGGEDFNGFSSDTSFDNATVGLADGMSIGTTGLIGFATANKIDTPPVDTTTLGNLGIDGSGYARIRNDSVEDIVISFGADFQSISDITSRTEFELFSDTALIDTIALAGAPLFTLRFFGFAADAGETITSIRLVQAVPVGSEVVNDGFGLDNIEFAAAATTIPEPGALALFAIAIAAVGIARRGKTA